MVPSRTFPVVMLIKDEGYRLVSDAAIPLMNSLAATKKWQLVAACVDLGLSSDGRVCDLVFRILLNEGAIERKLQVSKRS